MTAAAQPRVSLFVIEETLEQLEAIRAAAEADGDTEALQVIDAEIVLYLTKESEKIDSYAALIRRNEATIEACEEEMQRIGAIKRQAEATVRRLKANALSIMRVLDVKELKGSLNTFRRQANGGALPIDVAANLPASYQTATVKLPMNQWLRIVKEMRIENSSEIGIKSIDSAPDLATIRKDLDAGEDVPGARFGVRGENVRLL